MRLNLTCLLLLFSSLTYAQTYKEGDKVMVKMWYVKLVENGNDLDTRVQLGDIFKVSKVDGDSVFVGRGWILKDYVVPVGEAIDYFTDQINSKPWDSRGYHSRALAYKSMEQFDKAIADEETAIWFAPQESYYNCLGTLWSGKGEYDRALDAYDKAIQLNPLSAIPYHNRGKIWCRKKDYEKAIADFDESNHLDPKYTFAIVDRGYAWLKKGNYTMAINDYNNAILLDPKEAAAYSGLAWIWATCPDKQFRDGKKAIEYAENACELDNWQDASKIDNLAAAYAENEDFESAVKWEAKAIESKIPHWSYKKPEELKARLELYKSGKPYREELKK